MAEMLSPGAYVTEIDASLIVPTVSNSIAVFAGKFEKGPVESYTLITSVDDLITFYGLPNNDNFNDWYQVYNFLQYGNKIYVARAANINGAIETTDVVVAEDILANTTNVIVVANTSQFKIGQYINLGGNIQDEYYMITEINENVSIIVDRNIEKEILVTDAVVIFILDIALNGTFEAVGSTALNAATNFESDYVATNMTILNSDDFENKEVSIAFASNDSKLKFISRNPGEWSSDLEIAVANSSDFGVSKNAFNGIALDDLFEYAPVGSEVGIIVKLGDEIKEIYTVSFDEKAKDTNGKSIYVENVINSSSKLIFVKDNMGNTDSIKSYLDTETISLVLGRSSAIQADDLLTAYELWSNREYVDIDIVIANELYPEAAKALCDTRKDCIGFIGATYGDVVGKKAADAVANLIAWRKTGDLNYNNMFVVACGNYVYQYDRYNDKMRWVNIAGHIAGLRAQTSSSRASWWASAGLERGQIKGIKKLAFNPDAGKRDLLYKNGINPIVSFPGQGTVMWGQKTLLDKPSSFDRVNVRGLFNTMERALSKMAKYQVMEFNDNFTRNRIVSMIKPYLSSVQAGRGIQDFLVICDESNNTPDVISRNQLVVD